MDLEQLAPWPITPTRLVPTGSGVNNETYFVDATEGQFVLRVSLNTADPRRVRYEHELLGRLVAQELPFQTPAPVKTRENDTLAVFESAEGPRLATLFFRIPGEPGTPTTALAHPAGRALGQLDAALARVDLPVRGPLSLADVHPLVPDPLAALDDLDLGADRTRILALFERVTAADAMLSVTLPAQIVHSDFAFPNVLFDGKVVTGLVDFEMAAPDVRAADLACAIYITIVRAAPADRWAVLDSLITGYRRALPLDPTEAAAIPDLLLRRSASGIVHWIGRWRAGLCGPDEPLARVARNASLTDWLEAYAPRVVLAVAGEKLPAVRR
ncbi:MAG TPA: phosphotransferase [Candidatus Acidoferrales bacterium]|nr:phosphotransferase [Candidatus Acidoferrales bacterium]